MLDLSPGSLIHIEGYTSGGFAPKNKFLVLIGEHNKTTVLAFLITSNPEYLNTFRARELVLVPAGTLKLLPRDSYIQCFNEVERLDVAELTAEYKKGKIKSVGSLRQFLPRIRDIVEASDVLSPTDIEESLRVLGIALAGSN